LSQQGFWLDGRVAAEQPVELRIDGGNLALIGQDGERNCFARADLVRLEAPVGRLRLGHRGIEGWRLILPEPVDPEVRAILPARIGSLTPAIGRRKLSLLIGLSVAATLFAGVVVFAPEALAKRMPMSWERKLGSAHDLPIKAARCSSQPTRAALDALIDRVDPEARRDGFTLELVDIDVANAVALPGGRMVLFNGLVQDVDDPDAIAGIVAHEIAHVRRRHVASAIVRELGLGTVVAVMGGGAMAANAGSLASLRFSRGAEAEADSDAIDMLQDRAIDPRPIAAAFARFGREGGEGEGLSTEFLASHPLSEGRSRRFAGSFDRETRYRPALGPDEWQALVEGCPT
jgi:beta-barrel assembly-enhancing protease